MGKVRELLNSINVDDIDEVVCNSCPVMEQLQGKESHGVVRQGKFIRHAQHLL